MAGSIITASEQVSYIQPTSICGTCFVEVVTLHRAHKTGGQTGAPDAAKQIRALDMRDKKKPLRAIQRRALDDTTRLARVNVYTQDTPYGTYVSMLIVLLFMALYPPFSIHPTNARGGYGAKV